MHELAMTPDQAQAYMQRAQAAARMVPHVLLQRNLLPAVRQNLLTVGRNGDVWLFVVLDDRQINRMESYITPDLLHQMRTVLRGKPVLISNNTGLRYAILLSNPRKLPKRAPFPELQPGRAQLGIKASGDPVAIPWEDLGHLLVAGVSGSGKSVFLRLLAYQAIADGIQLALSDLDGATFPMLAGHSSLTVPISDTPDGALDIVRRALAECDRRKSLYQSFGVENLEEYNRAAVRSGDEPLPRHMVILDEYGATVVAAGGPESELSLSVAQLAWRGRKFGVHLVLAAQDISKAVVGKVRDHVRPIAFRLQSVEVARAMGCQQALRIPVERPGLAVTPWGVMQAFYLERDAFGSIPAAGLDDAGAELVRRAIQETGGRMSIPVLTEWGLTERQARELLDGWEQRGWVRRDPKQNNARYVAPVLAEIVSKRQTRQALSNG